jgi:hypothetical protein
MPVHGLYKRAFWPIQLLFYVFNYVHYSCTEKKHEMKAYKRVLR